MASSKPANWHLLPANLLISIAEKLFIADIIRLQVVCKEWGWSLGWPHEGWPTPPRLRASFIPIPPSVPWMLLPNVEGEDADYCSFLDLSNGHARRIHPVPEMVGRRCVGASPDGWLVTLDLELNPRVLNPLNREELPLPSLLSLFPSPANLRVLRDVSDGSLTGFLDQGAHNRRVRRTKKFRDKYIIKIVLTSAPPSGFAAVIYHCNSLMNHLALARVGDPSWTPVPIAHHQFSKLESVQDIFYDKERHKLFVVMSSGSVFNSDLHINDWPSGIKMSPAFCLLKLRSFASWCDKKPLSAYIGFNRHIIFSSGRLLLITIKGDEYDDREVRRLRVGLSLDEEEEEDDVFDSFTVKAETTRIPITLKQCGVGTSGWIPAKASDLDDQAIFVGCNHVFSVPAAGRSGLRKNSVYFTETSRYFLDWRQHVRDAAVFDVETGIFRRFFSLASENWPPPVWFMPSRLHFDFLS